MIPRYITQVLSVSAEPETDMNAPTIEGKVLVCRYMALNTAGIYEELVTCLRPGENQGWSTRVKEAVQEWLDAGNSITPYTPPTPEELRARLKPITARQFRLGMLYAGIALSQVDNYIANIQDPMQKEYAEIEWQYAGEFGRLHPLVVELSAHFLITPTELDTLWDHVRTM